jgi:hypothetical protein
MLLQDCCEVLVCGAADAFALEADEDCFARVGGKESVASLKNGDEVFWAHETDGEGSVDEVEVFLGGVRGVNGLHADVEETDSVGELGGDVGDLTPY